MEANSTGLNASLVASVDRNQGDQGLLLAFEVSDSTGFASASFQFESRDANGNWLNSLSAWANDWSSFVSGGDARNGKHVVMLDIPASAEEGTYQLSSFSLRDQAGNETYFQRSLGWSDTAKAALGIDPDTLNFSVSGQGDTGGESGTDAELPVISNISLSDRSIDRSSGERGTLLSFNATDQTGFQSADFGFEVRSDDGQWLNSTSVWTNAWSTLVNGGDEQSGSHVGLIEITPTAAAGNYELSYFSLRDQAGNQQYFNREFNWEYTGNGIYKPNYTWSDAAIQALGADPSALSFSVIGEAPADGNTDNALPTITNLRLDDNLIELGTGETGALLTLEASDATGFDYASFHFSLLSSSGAWLDDVTVWVNSWNSLASGGSNRAGQHVAQIEVPASAIAGTYELNSFTIADQAGNRGDFHRQTIWSGSGYGTTATQTWDAEAIAALGVDPGSLAFTVTNSGVLDQGADRELPVISNISFVEPEPSVPSSTKSYSSGELIQLEIELADTGVGVMEQATSGSGYSTPWIGNFTFRSPQGKQTVHQSISSADRISGDANQGVYRITLSLDANHEPGEWTLSDLSLQDARGNTLSAERQYGSGTWDSPITELQKTHLATRLGVDPSDLSFTFINPNYVEGSTDTQAPLLSAFNLGLSDPTQPDSWTATFSLTDATGSGYGTHDWLGSLEFRSPDGQQTVNRSINSSDRVSGDALSGSYSVVLPLNATHQPGQWTLTRLSVQDVNGNELSVYRQSNGSSDGPVSELQRAQMAARLGLTPEALSFNYVNPAYAGESADQSAPTLTNFSLGLRDNTDPSSWTATFNLTHATGSGYGTNDWIGSLEFRSPDGQQRVNSSINSSDRVSGDALSGSYSVAIPLDETHQPGEWTLSHINVQDALGNNFSVSRQSNSGAWDAPVTELQREHMAARLGLTPEALSFTYSNSSYQPASSIDQTPPHLKSLTWIGGEDSSEESPLRTVAGKTRPGRTVHEVSNMAAFAVILNDGTVASWGDPNSGGDSSGIDFDGPNNDKKVVQIYSSYRAFAALRDDGSVLTWGFAPYGGDSSGVDFNGPSNQETVVDIASNGNSFAAILSGGSVVTWGDSYGGNSYGVDFNGPYNDLKVEKIYATNSSYAALRDDGSVVTWAPYGNTGGDSSMVDFDGPEDNLRVIDIASTQSSFAALRDDGSVVTWGFIDYPNGATYEPVDPGSKVTSITSNAYSFAGLLANGGVVTWGSEIWGGDSSTVDFNGPDDNLVVEKIYSTHESFAAVRSDGSIIGWGGNYGKTASTLDANGRDDSLRIVDIAANYDSYAALRSDGSVITWGYHANGGNSDGVDFDGPQDNLKVVRITASHGNSGSYIGGAFAALRDDGSVITWGNPDNGGDSSDIDFNGDNNDLKVVDLFSTSSVGFYSGLYGSNVFAGSSFAALRSDGSVVAWGEPTTGGLIDASNPVLTKKVVAFADPFSDNPVAWSRKPAQPSIPKLAERDDSGLSDTDNITNVPVPTITGVAAPGSTISWLLDGVLYPANTAITTADPQTGEWSYTLPAEHAATTDGDYTLTVIATDADGNVSDPSDPLVITVDLTAPVFISPLEASAIEEDSGSGQIVYTASASDQHEVVYSLKGEVPFEIDPLTGSVRMTINPDYETQASHSFTVLATDLAGNSAEQQVSLAVLDRPDVQSITLSIPDVTLQAGKLASIPIHVDEAKGIESIDVTLVYDPTVFNLPQNAELITASTLSTGGTWAANTSTPGEIVLSWFGTEQLPAGAGSLGSINLEVNADAQPGTSPLLEMTSALVSEGLIPSNLNNGNTTIVLPSFQVLNVRHRPNGLALRLSEAPDMATFNLYDGPDSAVDAPDLQLTGADGKAVALSAHWQEEDQELHLLAAKTLAAGEYTLTIAARSDGLVSASSRERLDGNGDGINGDNYVLSFSRQGDEPFLAMADTARGAGQALSLNGNDFIDGLTGLPVLLSSSEALRSLSGSFVFDAERFLNADLRAGSALPDDWVLTIDPASGEGRIVYSAGGNSMISGNSLELFRFDAVVAPESTTAAVYGSTTLIEATATATRADNTNLELETDPGLVALAYSGDATGNGMLSSLDASRVQRTVVGLDSGFDAYDDINPTLIGDTTGNGSLSSLDASRIQQQVVGLSVDSFPKNMV